MKNQIPETTVEFAKSLVFENANQSNNQLVAESGLKRFSAACLKKFNQLKAAITDNLAAEFAGVLQAETIRQMVNEADSLAAYTPFPALFLPVLAEEKVVWLHAGRPDSNGSMSVRCRWQRDRRGINCIPDSTLTPTDLCGSSNLPCAGLIPSW